MNFLRSRFNFSSNENVDEPVFINNNLNKELIEFTELTLEDIFINLRLLSKLEVGNKLIKNNNNLNIDSSFLQSFTRWMNGTNRNDNLNFITYILNSAFDQIEKLIKLNTSESTQLFIRLTADLKNCTSGLLNLKNTYYNDKLIQSEIDVMIDNIRTKLDLNYKNVNLNQNIIISTNDNHDTHEYKDTHDITDINFTPIINDIPQETLKLNSETSKNESTLIYKKNGLKKN